jgi:hypothetical protein
VGSCEHGNDSSDIVKGGNILDQLSDCQLLKKSMLHGISFQLVRPCSSVLRAGNFDVLTALKGVFNYQRSQTSCRRTLQEYSTVIYLEQEVLRLQLVGNIHAIYICQSFNNRGQI